MSNTCIHYCMTKEADRNHNHFFHIDENTPERQIQILDELFLQTEGKLDVYGSNSVASKISDRSKIRMKKFHLGYGGDIPIHWPSYSTWSNLFHIRYEQLLKELGQSTEHQFFHPNVKCAVTHLMRKGMKPISLSEAIHYLRNDCRKEHESTAKNLANFDLLYA